MRNSKPAKRATEEIPISEVRFHVPAADIVALSPASQADYVAVFDLGFRYASPQALCYRLLRRLKEYVLRTLETPH